jgi:hypothetical protein
LRRSILLLAGAAITGALVFYPVIQNAPLAHAQSGACSSFPGYEQIQAVNFKMYVHSNGGGTAVTMAPTGSCYKPTKVGTYNGFPVYTYDNEDNRCLYWNKPTFEGMVYTATNANGCSAQPNEEFVAEYYTQGIGWLWYNLAAVPSVSSDIIKGYPCTNGGILTAEIPLNTNCGTWNFPSDGG